MTQTITDTAFQTQRLFLRGFRPGDAPALVTALDDHEMCHGLTVVPYPYTLDDAHWFINEGAGEALAVCRNDGALIGAMGLGKTFGYWIAKPYWGQGYATEAAKPVLDSHFSTSDAPVQSSYVDDNLGSARVLEKLGFEITGDAVLSIRSRGQDVPGKAVSLTKTRWENVH